jgi:hypothetical protein
MPAERPCAQLLNAPPPLRPRTRVLPEPRRRRRKSRVLFTAVVLSLAALGAALVGGSAFHLLAATSGG